VQRADPSAARYSDVEEIQRKATMRRLIRPGLAIASGALFLALGGCGSDASIEHTNAQQTEQLNQIADNTSESAGNGQGASSAADAAGQTLRSGAGNPPRKY
jgi:DNA-binding transcriptional MerR regulator